MKRTLDILIVLLALPLLGVLGLIVAGLIWAVDGRPILYVSERAGVGGAPFRFLKFRTMRGGAGTDAERLTRLGRFLRATSLDELPQLLHILSGQMSLVGPRPLPVRYLPRYSAEQARRHEVRPGLTGWAQVNGRNALDWPTKLRMDVWYVDHRSLALDARIVLLTIGRLFRRTGINHAGCDTMYEFTGEQGERK